MGLVVFGMGHFDKKAGRLQVNAASPELYRNNKAVVEQFVVKRHWRAVHARRQDREDEEEIKWGSTWKLRSRGRCILA